MTQDDLIRLFKGESIEDKKTGNAIQIVNDALQVGDTSTDLTNVAGYKKIKQLADLFGVEIPELLQNISLMGDIDTAGHTSKKLKDI